MTNEQMIEKVAEAWASIDGNLSEFLQCKEDHFKDEEHGYYQGYLEEAKELLERSGILNA